MYMQYRSIAREPSQIISWNADGLITHDGKEVFVKKIQQVANFVNSVNIDLLLIQESHMVKSDIPFVEAELKTNGFLETNWMFYWSTNSY